MRRVSTDDAKFPSAAPSPSPRVSPRESTPCIQPPPKRREIASLSQKRRLGRQSRTDPPTRPRPARLLVCVRNRWLCRRNQGRNHGDGKRFRLNLERRQRIRWRQHRRKRHHDDDPRRSDWCDGNRRQRASRDRLDGKLRRDQLSREARHRERRTFHTNLRANFNKFHRHRSDERHDLFLRCLRAQLRRRKRQLNRSQREADRANAAAIANSANSHRPHRNRWQCASFSHLGDQLWRHELPRKTQHDDRRPVHASLCANDRFLHRRQPYQRHKIFLRRLRAGFLWRKRQLGRSKRDTDRADESNS